MATGNHSAPTHQSHNQELTQGSPTLLRSTAGHAFSREVSKRLDASMVPYGNALKQAREQFNEGKLEAAEAECRCALAAAPSVNGKPWYGPELPLLGDILLAQGNYNDALECFLRVTTSSKPEDSEHPQPNLGAALAYCRLGNFEMAKKYYPQHDSPEWRAAWPGGIRGFEASLLFTRAGEEDAASNSRGALLYLRQAAKLAPRNWLVADVTGQTLDYLKHYEEAIPYYKHAVQFGGDKVSQRTLERAGVLKPTFLDGTPLPVVTPHLPVPETVKTPK